MYFCIKFLYHVGVGCVLRHESEVYRISINFLLAAATALSLFAMKLIEKHFFLLLFNMVLFRSECDDDGGAGKDEQSVESQQQKTELI